MIGPKRAPWTGSQHLNMEREDSTMYTWMMTAWLAGVAVGQTSPEKELQKFQGNWVVVAMEKDGKPLPLPQGQKFTVTFQEGGYVLPGGAGFTGSTKGTFRVDPTGRPPTIDLVPADGSHKGKTFPGIYALEGDTLKACYDTTGKERPKHLTTKDAVGQIMLTYKREK